MRAPVHIIGAGLMGLSTADSLLERGYRVMIWDRAPAPGMGASFANSGLLHPSQAAPWSVPGISDPLDAPTRQTLAETGHAMAQKSVVRLKQRIKAFGLEAAQHGLVQRFASAATRDQALAHYAGLSVVAEPTEWNGNPAIHLPDDCIADARAYALALATDLAARGAVCRMGEAVELARRDKGGFEITTASHQEQAGTLVIAAGHQTGACLAMLSLDSLILGVAGHAVGFDRPKGFETPTVMDTVSRSALTMMGDHVRLSGSVGVTHPDDLLAIWSEIAPDLIARLGQPTYRWTGYRPVTVDGRPIMGATALDGLFVNTGHAHMGWTQCAEAGEIVAKAVLDQMT